MEAELVTLKSHAKCRGTGCGIMLKKGTESLQVTMMTSANSVHPSKAFYCLECGEKIKIDISKIKVKRKVCDFCQGPGKGSTSLSTFISSSTNDDKFKDLHHPFDGISKDRNICIDCAANLELRFVSCIHPSDIPKYQGYKIATVPALRLLHTMRCMLEGKDPETHSSINGVKPL